MTNTPAPIALPTGAQHPSRPRDDLADELRGFALLGIVAANAPFIAISSIGFTEASVASGIDRTAALAVWAFVQAKFYVLFSFLFGYSLSYQLKDNSPEQRQVFRRRLFGLGVLGVIHGTLLFAGDILLLYALLGSVLLALVARSDRAVLWAAAACGLLWALTLLLLGTLGVVDGDNTAGQRGNLAHMAAVDTVLANGSFWQAALARIEILPVGLLANLAFSPAVFGLFCVGLVAGRARVLRQPERHLQRWRLGLVLGLIIGLPAALLSATGVAGPGASFDAPGARENAALALCYATAPALSLAYVSAIALLHIRWPNLLRIFRPAGRMSLTGYIGESVLLSLIFSGFGAGLMGQLGAGAVTAVALGVWLLLAVFAQQWQKRFNYGPLEYLLRRWSLRS